MKLAICLVILLASLTSCSSQDDASRIYYFSRQAPGVNLFSVDQSGTVQRHTIHKGARDIDLTVDADGNLFFTSNRVLPEDRAERAKQGRAGDRRQDLNVFYLPHDQREQDRFLAAPVEKTKFPESQAVISGDGQHMAFVRALPPDEKPVAAGAPKATEELYVKAGTAGEAKKIYAANLVVKPQWSPDGTKLVFATYDYAQKKAHLLIYDRSSGKVETVLENPWESFQIDSPQWSPDGKRLSLISHPVGVTANRGLYVLELDSKALQRLSAEAVSVQAPVSWGRKSQHILYGALVDYKREWNKSTHRVTYQGSSQLFLSDLDGKTTQLTKAEQGIHANPVFAPDNKAIAYIHTNAFQDREASLRVIDRSGKAVATLAEDVAPNTYLIWQ